MRAAPLLFLFATAAIGGGAYSYWSHEQAARVPPGLARAIGRIEVERVDIAAKHAGRLAEMRVREGDAVAKGDIVARMDLAELLAQRAAARAAVRRAVAGVARAESEVAIRAAERCLSEVELKRAAALASTSAMSAAELDRRKAQHAVAEATVDGARAAVGDARAAVEVAEAQAAQVEALIADMTLLAPAAASRPSTTCPTPT